MGSSVERFLQETGGTQAPSRRSSVDQFLDETGGDPKRLSLATRHAVPGERAARILELEKATSLTPDFIDRNFDEVDKQARAVDHDPERFKRQAPALFAQIAENHYNAGLLGDDIGPLSRAESLLGRLKAGFRAGRAEGQIGRIGAERRDVNYARPTGGIDDATRREIDRLEEIIAATPKGRTFLERSVTSASKIIGQMSESLAYAGAVGLGGASTGAAIGAVGGPVTAGAGAALGFAGGFTAGLAYDAFRVEGGHNYVTLSEDPSIDEGTRQSVSYGVGLVNAALETGGAAAVGAAYKPLVRRFFRQSVADALARPTMRGAVVDFGKAYALALAGETSTEVAQEITSMVGEEIARMGDGGELEDLLLDPEKREVAFQRLAQIAQETAEGMAILALPGAGVRFTGTAYEARKATQRERYFTALGETMAESKALKRLPSAVQDLVARQTQDGPLETLYMPTETFVSYFQSAKLDPAAVAKELGVEESYRDALATGSDIAIPTGVYATRLAPTEHNAYFAKELRRRPNEMNAREAGELLDALEKAKQDAAVAPSEEKAVDSAGQIGETVAQQLVEAGYDEGSARAQSRVYESAFRTLGQRAGVDPLELFNRYGFTVERVEPPRAPGAGPAISLADVANRALVFRETQTERQGLAAEEAGETYSPYAVQREKRDAVARSESGEFLYARTAKGALRGNLKSITTDGLIEELAFIYEQLAEDQGLIRQTVAPDENFHTFEDGRDHISFKGQAVKAIGRMQSRQKAIARLEAELERRGVTDAGDRLNRQILGEDTTFDPNTFQQSGRRLSLVAPESVSDDIRTSDEKLEDALAEGTITLLEYDRAIEWKMYQQFLRANPTKPGDDNTPTFDEYLWDEHVGEYGLMTDEARQRGMVYVERILGRAPQGRFPGGQSETTFQQSSLERSPLPAGFEDLEQEVAEAVRRRKRREAIASESALTRYMALLDLADDPTESADRREEAAKQAADTEQDARAEYDKRFKDANAKMADDPNAILYHQPAYHGSPHIFDRFSLHHIGSGEGAQAYGWGLYFSGSKEIAKYYRDTLVPRAEFKSFKLGHRHLFRNGEFRDYSPRGNSNYENVWATIAEELLIHEGDLISAVGADKGQEFVLRVLDERIRDMREEWPEGVEAAERLRADLAKPGAIDIQITSPTGRLYEVDIPGDETMLLWDQPLRKQPKVVQEAIRAFLKAQGYLREKDNGPRVLTSGWRSYVMERAGMAEGDSGGTIYGAIAEAFGNKDASDIGWTQLVNTANDQVTNQEKASRFLASLGVNGIKYRAGQIANIESDAFNYVIFDDEIINITNFEQALPGGDAPRGQIRFKVGDQAAVSIELLADADLSTFLHETGHFYLEVLKDLATSPDAVPDIVRDFDIIKQWVGWQDGQTAFTREQHEQWARGFEAYLMTGKAPSTELRSAFAKFRAWLVSLYRSLDALQAMLSDDVRGVMDRMLATEDEIAAAEREQQMQPLFPDPAAFGMSEQQAAHYRATIEGHRETAIQEVQGKLIAQIQREQDAIYQAERRRVRAEVAEEVNQERDSAALAFLSRGALPDGSPLPADLEAVKLSKASLAEYEGRHRNLLPLLRAKGFLYAKEGGVHPDQVAEWFGYASGDELLQALLAYEGTPKQRIERLTDERMRAEDPNLVTPRELAVEAMEATHNEQRAQVLYLELQHLVSQDFATFKGLVRRLARRLPPVAEVRAQAERIIRHKKVRDIAPVLYQRAEAKAARASLDAGLKGDWEAAFDEKLKELLNHELYRAAVAARETVEKTAEFMARFGKTDVRAEIGKAGGDYLEQIDALLDRFDFRKSVTNRAIDRRRGLRDWYEEQKAAGEQPVVPEKLLDEAYRTHYKEMTPDELTGLRNTVAQIAHLAGRKNSLLTSQRARSIEEATRTMTDGIGTHHDIETPKPEGHGPRGAKWRLGKFAKQGLAEHTRMEFLFDFLDGYKGLGPVWEHLFKPFVDAEAQENQLLAETAAEMQRIMAAYTKDERNAWYDRKVFIREAVSTKHDGNFTKAAVLAVALNWGNEYNRDALMQGYEWNRNQVEAILDTLDQRDWQTVQAIWDHIDSFWGRVEALEKELNGIAPEKVERSPFVTRTGQQMAGGYYPVIFDREKSLRQAKYDEASTVREMFGGNWAQAMTRHGHTIERTSTGGKALKLEISGLTDHLGQVIHDLAFRKPVIDVRRLLNEEALQQAIARAAGPEMYRQLGPWLHAIAGDRQREFSGVVETILGRARQGATTVGLGLKITSGLMQSLGYFNAVNELGPRYAAKGLRAAFKNPLRAFRMVNDDGFIGQRSPMMRDRLKNYDRDVRDFARRQSLLEASESSWFFLIGYADLLTSIPAWLGAYQKAMDGGLEGVEKGNESAAIDYADKVVRETQAAGAAKDLAQIQRGGEGHRLFTLFYSSLSVLFNQFARAGHRYSLERNLPQLVATLTLVWFLPAVMEQIIRGNGPDDEDDPVEWVKFYARKIAVFPFASVVLLRDLANAIERRFEYGRVDFRGSPIGEVGQTIAEAFYALAVKPLSDDEITRADIKDVLNTIGYYAKLPTQQLIKTGEYLLDWLITGEEEPDNIATGLYEAAVTGKRRQ